MRRHYRSFFWPVVLIAIGIFALLIELNVISTDRIYRLADLWPLILIVIGLEIITRRTMRGAAVDVAAVLILVIAAGAAIVYVSVGPAIPGGTQTLTASDQLGTLHAATLDVEVGAADLTVASNGDIGKDLYRAVINYSGKKPTVAFDKSTGDLRISQDGDFGFFGSLHLAVDLQINPAVSWGFKVNTGATNATLKLSDVKVTSIDSNTGAGRLDITVGQPMGFVQIKVNGGALTVLLHRPSGTQVSARVSGGAVSLTADGHHTGTIGNADWQSDGYGNVDVEYNLRVSGGACTVTVDTNVPAA